MEISFLFDTPIREITELHPGYEDHASNVWQVKTDEREVIVRSSRMHNKPDNPFWGGLAKTFQINPRNVSSLKEVNTLLNKYSSFPIPSVLKMIKGKTNYIIVEKLKGEMVSTFNSMPASVLESLGEGIAAIHRYQSSYAGNPSGSFKVELSHFHVHLSECIENLAFQFYSENHDILALLPVVKKKLSSMPPPLSASLVLPDIDATQFLVDKKSISGLVDTEAYVIAPREFDFIALEYLLTKTSAEHFKAGYEKIMETPNLEQCRFPYRFFYRLLEVQGQIPIEQCLNQPALF